MIFAGEALFLAELCLIVYCVLNIITTPEAEVRHLPKLLWLVLVIVLPLVGGIAWLLVGRPQGPRASLPYKGNQGVPSAYDRPGRATAASPDDDEAFLQGLRQRADAQRSEAARRRREELEREEQERKDAWRRRHGGEPTA
ncbi:MAG TPA: PLDc N-terminal domain-containing protein [Mycobacteriales bacterium]|jgi:hypothetical protein|nr:PLDc N-terminal domain-containing protein [Mycobacteriales bacterium]